MTRRLITVRQIVHRELISFHGKSYSRAKAMGRWSWVTRCGPVGPSGRLWVDIDQFALWLQATGTVVAHDWKGLVTGAVLVDEPRIDVKRGPQ